MRRIVNVSKWHRIFLLICRLVLVYGLYFSFGVSKALSSQA